MCSPPLDAHERDAWNALRVVLGGFSRDLSTHLQRAVGLSYFEYEILETLAESPESTRRLGDLAAACRTSPSTLSRAMARLESRDLVTRRLDPADGRYVVGELTGCGAEVLRAGTPEHVGQLRRVLFDALTEVQIRQLTEICAVLGRTLAAEARRHDQH